MSKKTVLILERSSQNLKKISKNGRTVLEGVFAEFGIENRNGRIYEEKEYLPHMDYLKKDINNGNLLGELDHPERFEISLGNVSHKITELWYDQSKRQVLGRIEILDGTPKGQIAKTLLEAGVPLSISSRAAGSVNEDKSVSIQQIYTYDIVAKPGFEAAQLHAVNENVNTPETARIAHLLENFNNSYDKHQKDSINSELGILNENLSIIDVTDKYPSVSSLNLREEASLIQKNNTIMEKKQNVVNDAVLEQWTQQFNGELAKLSEKVNKISESLESKNNFSDVHYAQEIVKIKKYLEKLRKIQESAVNWQEDMAKAINKVGRYSDNLAKKSNEHYDLTQKIVETVDHNAKTLNATQDWISENAKVTNAVANASDYNADMLNKMNEWTEEIAKSVNVLNEWGEQKAKAINALNEWTGSIAKGLNTTAGYSEEMFGRSLSKGEAKKLIKYIELIGESKKDPKLKKTINEMLNTNSIKGKKLNENKLKSLEVLDASKISKKVGNTKVGGVKGIDSVDQFSGKFRGKHTSLGKGLNLPKGLSTVDKYGKNKARLVVSPTGKKLFVLDNAKTTGKKDNSIKMGSDGPTAKMRDMQYLKKDQKPIRKLKESVNANINRTNDIKTRSSKLNERLNRIVEGLEKERAIDEEIKSKYPFTTLLSKKDRKRFEDLSASDKQKVAESVNKVPTIESGVVLKLWENALSKQNKSEPLWLELAPNEYKNMYNKASKQLKESITARASFYELNTQYQINNFWETSGLKQPITLNENVIASNSKSKLQDPVDPMVDAIGKKMMSYNQ